MKRITTFLMLGLAITLQTAICQEAKAPVQNAQATIAPPQVQPAPASGKPLRDPFWPIGYWPGQGSLPPGKKAPIDSSKPQIVPPPQEVVIRWPDLKVKGLTRQSDGTYIAIIDGIGIVEAGQIVKIQRDGFIFRYKISEINQKGILQQKLDYKPKK